MRYLTLLLLFLAAPTVYGQDTTAPAPIPSYCSEGPDTYSKSGEAAAALPKFATTPTKEYKVQVAILRHTDPSEYPFHPTLVARYRPCEQMWVIESRQSFTNRDDAVALQNELESAGYAGSYITDLVAYQ